MESLVSDLWNAIKTFSPGAVGAAFAALTGPIRKRCQRALEFCGGLAMTFFLTEPALDIAYIFLY